MLTSFPTRRLGIQCASRGLSLLAVGLCLGCEYQQSPNVQPAPQAQPVPQWIEDLREEQTLTDGIPGFWIDAPAEDAEVIPVSAEEFTRDFLRNQDASLAKHSGCWTEVTGVVEDISPGTLRPYLVLCGLQRTQGNSTTCRETLHFNLLDDEPWRQTSVGATITVRGALAPEKRVIRFDHATIIGDGGTPTLEVSAADLARQHAGDPDQLKSQYDRKQIIVSGQVHFCGMMATDVGELHRTLLAGEGETLIELNYFSYSDHGFDQLEVGQQISVIGKCNVRSGDFYDHKILIDTAQLLPQVEQE